MNKIKIKSIIPREIMRKNINKDNGGMKLERIGYSLNMIEDTCIDEAILYGKGKYTFKVSELFVRGSNELKEMIDILESKGYDIEVNKGYDIFKNWELVIRFD
jgi:hypothetical protein